MNQYCYDVISETIVDPEQLKGFVQNLYRKKKFKELAFTKDEILPFIVLYSQADSQICIKMTSKAKKNVERIENIHKKLKPVDLKVSNDVNLEKPKLFEIQQCAWWDDDCKIAQGKQKWTTLEHNGPYFTHLTEEYEPHGAPLIYDGVEYVLSPEEERIANFYARRIISEGSGNVAQIWTKDKVFNNNFWTDFKKYLSPQHKKIFKSFNKLDFSAIVDELEAKKEADKQLSAAEKTAKKVKAAERKQNYGYAVINGIKEPVGNFTIEPAAIFYGRGENPKRGKIKRDIDPEEVTINIGETAIVPDPPIGHTWKEVIHDHNAAWIASWKDPISNENKYVYLGAEGQLKGKSDLAKYEKARKLNYYLDTVREQYYKDLESVNPKLKQLGTVLYLIDKYGLRVGNEKDESETDTVGASTLRVEHVKLKEPNIVVFDFLGKDSIRYYKEIKVEPEVFDNVQLFMENKQPSAPLFDLISAADINSYLKTFDKDFSAKVFRTRLASQIMYDALQKTKVKKNATQDDKKALFLKANVQVANVLNHRRTAPAKSQDVIKKYQDELKELRKKLKEAKDAGKSTKSLEERIKKKKNQVDAKKSTLNIAATTSLTNYIDPRIVASWAKEHGMNIPKVYTATLQRKFKWAIDTTEDDWNYEDTDLLPEMANLNPADPTVPGKKPVVAKKAPIWNKLAVGKKPIAKKTPVWNKLAVAKKAPVSTELLISKPLNVEIIDYSAKSIAVIGDTKPYKDLLQDLGGRFNKFLTVKGSKVPGWIFSNNKRGQVEEALGMSTTKPVEKDDTVIFEPTKILSQVKATKPKEREKTWDDIMNDHQISQKEKNIIKCFAKDPNVLQFLKDELIGPNVNKKIYNVDFLARFLSCLEAYDQSEAEREKILTSYQTQSYQALTQKLLAKIKPSSIPTYMFLLFILYKVSSRMREQYLKQLLDHIKNKQEIQECLCDNSNDQTLITDESIKSIDMDNLYLLPSGRCIDLDYLISHFKFSGNKNTDPTFNKFKHGSEQTQVWTNGWELKNLLSRIQQHDPSQGKEILESFEKVLKTVSDDVPEKTKQMINDMYVLFYFPEAQGDNKRIIDMLVKYGYPSGEGKGNLKKAKDIVVKGDGDELDEFRTVLGFQLGQHILEELSDSEREAVLFAGEFAGMGREAWGKLSMGTFCTKTFGAILHRLADLFAGKWYL